MSSFFCFFYRFIGDMEMLTPRTAKTDVPYGILLLRNTYNTWFFNFILEAIFSGFLPFFFSPCG